tara:strand:+ start:259 stop:771 length:513 start_codon:yes stop_codon:yes gene_type:complete
MKDKMRVKYNAGSMLSNPEIEAELEEMEGQEAPEDTYDNIPEDEVGEALASQLPDGEMEDDFQDFVLDQALEEDEQDFLLSALEQSEQLAVIFEKIIDVAAEFSGAGAVEGNGTGVSDSIPARLSDGEFVFTAKAVEQIGVEQLQLMMDEAEQDFDGTTEETNSEGYLAP